MTNENLEEKGRELALMALVYLDKEKDYELMLKNRILLTKEALNICHILEDSATINISREIQLLEDYLNGLNYSLDGYQMYRSYKSIRSWSSESSHKEYCDSGCADARRKVEMACKIFSRVEKEFLPILRKYMLPAKIRKNKDKYIRPTTRMSSLHFWPSEEERNLINLKTKETLEQIAVMSTAELAKAGTKNPKSSTCGDNRYASEVRN